jgi:hypothetical protein
MREGIGNEVELKWWRWNELAGGHRQVGVLGQMIVRVQNIVYNELSFVLTRAENKGREENGEKEQKVWYRC